MDAPGVPGCRHERRRSSVQRQADRPLGVGHGSTKRGMSGICSSVSSRSTGPACRAGCAVLRPVPAVGRATRVPATLPGRNGFVRRIHHALRMDARVPIGRRAYRYPGTAPTRTVPPVTKDYDNFLSRLAAYPRQVDQVIELMRRGLASGWVLPAVPSARSCRRLRSNGPKTSTKARSTSPSRISPTRSPRPIDHGSRPGGAS